MIVDLAYGKQGLKVELPNDGVTVIAPAFQPELENVGQALLDALRQPIGTKPLKELVKPGQRVAIAFSDLTRPQPRKEMLRALLDELAHVPAENITLINGLGTHRPNTPDELVEMLGADLVRDYHVVQSECHDMANMTLVGTLPSGAKLYIHRAFVEADVKILTGFIEPHLFAGFSGGPKGMMPGIAALETVMANHNYERLASPKATWGFTHGNPVWEEILAAAEMVGIDFIFNVAINRDKAITHVVAGDLKQAHAEGISYVRANAMTPVPHLYDVVITTNSGYPLDLNLYQGIKGVSAAAQIVKPGGAILLAAECWDGIPEHGEFAALLREHASAQELLQTISQPGYSRQDQWQAQILAQTLLKARVFVYSDHLSDEQLREALVQPCRDISQWLAERKAEFGEDVSICVMPEGPMTIPYLA